MWNDIYSFVQNSLLTYPNLILECIPDDFIIVEKMIDTVRIDDEGKVFNSIYSSIIDYAKISNRIGIIDTIQVSEYFNETDIDQEVLKYIRIVEKRIIHDRNKYPTIICHNDFHIDNIVTDNNKDYYLIDFETAGENVFFSDIIGLIANSAIFHRRPFLFDQYIKGQFDYLLSSFFSTFGMKYDYNDKLKYIYLFLYFKFYYVSKLSKDHLSVYIDYMWTFFDSNGSLERDAVECQ